MTSEKPDSERQFLHDISTPLSSAMFLLESLIESFQTKSENAVSLEDMQMMMTAMETIKGKLEDRRAKLIPVK